ncbi:MAG: UDP-N-acetylmuramoyl-tripeptide--D-alanyl-D-alanine ligase [Streptosporangiales bacterium]|nr:UDP-N-acetylmuramoyl-tripeptide--D-alanyl-D-alanine ligase [Streptosporangiales bacterium]
MTLSEIRAAVGGSLVDGADPGALVTGAVVVDSRTVAPGDLFVAVPGDHVDGHEYATSARQRGAVAALVTRSVGEPAVLVDDTVAALARLAHAVAARIPHARVVGVTGSAGKTGTKDLLAQLLPALGPTIAPPHSYNNELGLPLTVLTADDDTACLVLEMGAKGIGHIRDLCAIAPPHVGVVLNVGTAHLGMFGSRDAIAQAKGELVEALPPAGVAVLNADDERVLAMAGRTRARVVRFAVDAADAEVRAVDVRLDESASPSFTLLTSVGEAPVRLRLRGAHQVPNALAAAAVAVELGIGVTDVAKLLGEAGQRSPHRMEVLERADGVTVVNDAYNANPVSAAAALEALRQLAGGRRRLAVLGEMLELGDSAAAEHERLGRVAAQSGVDVVVAVGEGARPVVVGAESVAGWPGRARYVTDGASAEELLADELRGGDVVLFKSSRDAGLRWVGDRVAGVERTQA